jgi:hypothetical protein
VVLNEYGIGPGVRKGHSGGFRIEPIWPGGDRDGLRPFADTSQLYTDVLRGELWNLGHDWLVVEASSFCPCCGQELREDGAMSIAQSFASILHRPASALSHGAALWAQYRRAGRARLTFSDGAGVAYYRMDGKTFRDLLPASEIGHQTALTAGALWAEAYLALGRDEQAATPSEWERLLAQHGFGAAKARDMRGALLAIARDGDWTQLDEAIQSVLE